jgi:hypothetical protein
MHDRTIVIRADINTVRDMPVEIMLISGLDIRQVYPDIGIPVFPALFVP